MRDFSTIDLPRMICIGCPDSGKKVVIHSSSKEKKVKTTLCNICRLTQEEIDKKYFNEEE
jgi:hypothetical protein